MKSARANVLAFGNSASLGKPYKAGAGPISRAIARLTVEQSITLGREIEMFVHGCRNNEEKCAGEAG